MSNSLQRFRGVAQNAPRYAVFIYEKNTHDSLLPRWKKVSSTSSAKRALKYAQLLNHSKDFERVEIKKYFFCQNTKRIIGKTIKILQPNNFSLFSLLGARNINIKRRDKKRA